MNTPTNEIKTVLIGGKWHVDEHGTVHGPYATSWDAIEALRTLRAGKTATTAGEQRTRKDAWVRRERQKEAW